MAGIRKEVIGDATLYLGDCREVLPTLSVDAIVCDPPYGQDYKAPAPRPRVASSRGLNGHWRRSERATAARVQGDTAPFNPRAILAAAPVVAMWGAHRFADRLPLGRWLVWDKRVDMPSIDQGDGEAAWIRGEGPMRIIRHRWHGLIIQPNTEESARQPGTSHAQARCHPTQKPVAVMRRTIEEAGLAAPATVCDPYMGSGSTGVACAQMGLSFIGIEIELEHFETACARIEAAYAQPRLFAEPVAKPTKPADMFADYDAEVNAREGHAVAIAACREKLVTERGR